MQPLSESFEVHGYWFLPDNHNYKIPGTLSYTPGRTELRLLQSFQAFPHALIHPLVESPVIYGITQKGEPVTILRAVRDTVSFSAGGGGLATPETWLCLLTVYGAYVENRPTFKEMRCRVPGLHIWQSQRLVEYSSEADNDAKTYNTSYRIVGRPAETVQIAADDFELDWYVEHTTSTGQFNVEVRSVGWFGIRPSAPQTVEWYVEQQQKIITLLTLLAGTPMSPDALSVPTGEPHRYASLLFTRQDVKYCSYKNLHEFFIPRGAIGAVLSEIVIKWFNAYPDVATPSQLAMSVYGSERLWQHVEFLSWMQALEGFHRGLLEGVYMDTKDYETVKSALATAIPSIVQPPHREALRSRIRYGNELSLAKRLNELADRLSESVRLQVLGPSGKIPRSWIDTRNFYTHWDEELRPNTLNGQGMLHANHRMSLFLKALYLDLAGVPSTAISSALGGHSNAAQWLIQINAQDRAKEAAEKKGERPPA